MPDPTHHSGPRRLLVTTAISHHRHNLDWNRPELINTRDEVIDLLTCAMGYEHIDLIGMDPTAQELKNRLNEFVRSKDRRTDDLIVVYITCHGEIIEETGEHVLLAADTDPHDLRNPQTTVATAELAKLLLAGTAVRSLLLILDTCHSGQGSRDLLSAAVRQMDPHWARRAGGGFVILHSAQPFELAEAGAFPRLLSEAVQDLSTAGHAPETLALDAVVEHMNANGTRPGHQTIGWDPIGLSGRVPPFLANPRHDMRLTEVDLALQQAAVWDDHAHRRGTEFSSRFLPRVMADHRGGPRGWWFEGRTRALRDICTWLSTADPDPAQAVLPVTAGPGSGKTAVLGLIAALTHPDHRRIVPVDALGLWPTAIPEVGAVDVAIYAQRLNDEQVLDGIAAAARVKATTVGELLDALTSPAYDEAGVRPFTVLIDALDEATTPRTLCTQILRPLIEHARGRIRFLLGTRPFLLPHLGLDRCQGIELDAVQYADPSALRAYTIRNLVNAHPNSPYCDQPPEYVVEVAEAIAQAADTSFLVARITASTLAASPHLPSPRDTRWQAGLPRHAGEAMAADLTSRLGHDVQRARDLLRPLAFAEGQGLPWEGLWAPLASAMSGRFYTDADLYWLRETAGSYVVEALESDRSAYRLYHQALVEHLREGVDEKAAQQAFVDILIQHVPYMPSGLRDWSRAHPYALRYLPAHAVHAGSLDTVITDPGALVHTDPIGLIPYLHRASSAQARTAVEVYRASSAIHRQLPPSQRQRLLAIDAARCGVLHLVQALTAGVSGYSPVWATGSGLPSPALTARLDSHADSVVAMSCTTLPDGTLIAITRGGSGTVQVWDLTNQEQIAHLDADPVWQGVVECMTLPDGTPIALIEGGSGAIQVRNLINQEQIAVLDDYTDPGRVVVTTALPEGTPVAVTGHSDGSVRVWDLTTHQQAAHLHSYAKWKFQMACTTLRDGTPVVVTGGIDSVIRVWDLVTHQQISHLDDHDASWGGVMACTTLPDGAPIAVTGYPDGTVRAWDLSTHQQAVHLGTHSGPVSAVACTTLPDGTPIAVTGGRDSAVQVWNLATQKQMVRLTGHTKTVRAISCTVLPGGIPAAVTGSDDGSVRVWDLTYHRSPDDRIGHSGPVFSVACTTLPDGTSAAVTGGRDRVIRVWDLNTHQQTAHLDGYAVWAFAVSCKVLNTNTSIAVIGSESGSVRFWDLTTQEQIARLTSHTGPVFAVACATLSGGIPAAVTGGKDGAVLLWNLSTHQKIASLPGHSGPVFAVASTNLPDGTPAAVTGGKDGSVRVWNLTNRQQVAHLDTHIGSVKSLACTALPDGTPIAVVGGETGSVRLWSLTSGRRSARLGSHYGPVSAVACASLPDGTPIAITGGKDKTLQAWDLKERSRIDLIPLPSYVVSLAVHRGDVICACESDIIQFRL